jgi:hypothetical protein
MTRMDLIGGPVVIQLHQLTTAASRPALMVAKQQPAVWCIHVWLAVTTGELFGNQAWPNLIYINLF